MSESEPSRPTRTAGSTAARTSPTGADTGKRVFLHIGCFKTGTSFIQSVLIRNPRALERDRAHFPLRGRGWAVQVLAARDVLKIPHFKDSAGGWDAVLADFQRSTMPTQIMSMEFLSMASADDAQRIVADLEPMTVEVILTVRDLVRVLPSAWQSMIKQGRRWPFDEFLECVVNDEHRRHEAAARFWKHHDVSAILDTWLTAVPGYRFHVVTVPPSGAPPATLWERFSSVANLDAGAYDITQDESSNFSLSYSDTELLRQVNVELGDTLSPKAMKKLITRYLANQLLIAPSADDTKHDRATVDVETARWAARVTEQQVATIRDRGVHVVGTLDDLAVSPSTAPGLREPTTTYPVHTARVIARLVQRIAVLDPRMPDRADDARGADIDFG